MIVSSQGYPSKIVSKEVSPTQPLFKLDLGALKDNKNQDESFATNYDKKLEVEPPIG